MTFCTSTLFAPLLCAPNLLPLPSSSSSPQALGRSPRQRGHRSCQGLDLASMFMLGQNPRTCIGSHSDERHVAPGARTLQPKTIGHYVASSADNLPKASRNTVGRSTEGDAAAGWAAPSPLPPTADRCLFRPCGLLPGHYVAPRRSISQLQKKNIG